MDVVYAALTALRAPIQQGEYDLHRLVMDALDRAAIPYRHEYVLAPRCRIDLFCGGVGEKGIGIEVKRGRPQRGQLIAQLTKYAASPEIAGLILVAERSIDLPRQIAGKPVKLLCLNRLWGIAL